MIFTDADNAVSTLVDDAVRVPHVYWRCEWPRVAARVLPVETLVSIVGEVDCSVLDEVATAPVFMDSCSGAVAWRGNVGQRAVRFSLDDYVPALVRRAEFIPVEIVSVDSELV